MPPRPALKSIAVVLLLLVSAVAHPSGAKTYTLLAVFAHPDDEMSIGPLLAKYASEGHAVHLVTAGSGEQGVTAHGGIPAGDTLGAARREETRCAARKLGIREPSLLALKRLATEPTRIALADRLRALIDQLKPDIVITWGPEGLTGHAHHIAIGQVVTQVFRQQHLVQHKPRKLYYVAYPESRFPKVPLPFVGQKFVAVPDALITTIVDGGRFAAQARDAIACHQTQLDAKGIREMYQMIAETLEGKVFLRLAFPAVSVRETNVFDGLMQPAK